MTACLMLVIAVTACERDTFVTDPLTPPEGLSLAKAAPKAMQYKSLAAGTHTVCALSQKGEAYCWGLNDFGQLGDSSTVFSTTRPRAVAGGHQFKSIDFAYQHGCGIEKGTVWCWGHNDRGQLGVPLSQTVSRYPVRVQGNLSFSEIALGSFHSCGIGSMPAGTSSGYCWGSNQFGQLGNGELGTIEPAPVQVFNHSFVPGLIPQYPILTFYWLEASAFGTCGLSEGVATSGFGNARPGFIECWGLNNGRSFGNTWWNAAPQPEIVLPELDITSTQLSLFNTSACAISAGTSYCWGGTGLGETGDGTTIIRPDPVPVLGPSFVTISTGASHSCGIAPGGKAYCWGANVRGQLGSGTTAGSLVPVPVASSLKFKEIYAGGGNPSFAFTCALTSQGEAYCWGANDIGQLGDGTSIDRHIPTAVLDPM